VSAQAARRGADAAAAALGQNGRPDGQKGRRGQNGIPDGQDDRPDRPDGEDGENGQDAPPRAQAPPSSGSGRRRATSTVRRGLDGATAFLEDLPLRVRLVAVVVVLMLAALVLTTVVTSLVLHRQLLASTDRDLRVAAGPVASAAFEEIAQNRNPGESIPTNYAVVVMPTDGSQLHFFPASVSAKAHPAMSSLALGDRRVLTHDPFNVPSTDDSSDWRVIATYLPNRSATVAVAVSLDSVDDTVARLLTLEALSGLSAIGACAVLGWYAVRRAFRPLTQIEDTAAAIAAGDLARRVPEPSAQDEVSSLSRSLNSMLSQIESSFAVREASEQRMRQFVADASHELRTPLAAVRGYAELFRQGAVREPEDIAGAMRRIEDEATRMGGLVEDMLLLTRLDTRRPMQSSPVDLTVLAADAAQDALAIAPDRKIRVIGLRGPLRPTVVDGDDARLRQVVTNLLGNAIRHTPAGTPVELAVGTVSRVAEPRTGTGAGTESRGVIEVRDRGPGVAPAQARKVFERFFRADRSRVRGAGGGNGLGLAIVAAIVAAHHGKVGVAPREGGGATFVVELPSADSQDSPRDS
jgi:two-component system OmpR family sensor kinase